MKANAQLVRRLLSRNTLPARLLPRGRANEVDCPNRSQAVETTTPNEPEALADLQSRSPISGAYEQLGQLLYNANTGGGRSLRAVRSRAGAPERDSESNRHTDRCRLCDPAAAFEA